MPNAGAETPDGGADTRPDAGAEARLDCGAESSPDGGAETRLDCEPEGRPDVGTKTRPDGGAEPRTRGGRRTGKFRSTCGLASLAIFRHKTTASGLTKWFG